MTKRIQYVKDPKAPSYKFKDFVLVLLIMIVILALVKFVGGPNIPLY